MKLYGEISLKALIKSSAFYKCYSKIFTDDVLISAKYIKHDIENDKIVGDDMKFDYANKLLIQYSFARYIVTSRIHCALPCLGIGTPVLYVVNQQQAEVSSCRLDGLVDLFHVIKCDGDELFYNDLHDKISASYVFNNKDNHIELAEQLNELCASFVSPN
ncbi:MAG: hypothetical protein WCI01_03740 [Chlorobiaceae bacterium]